MANDGESPNPGPTYLAAVDEQDSKCMSEFSQWVQQNSTPEVQKAQDAIGAAFWLLNGIATCEGGCRGGDHVPERIIARAASNAKGARILLQMGYYDEALSLIRQIGETANLIGLFVTVDGTFSEWMDEADERRRREKFGPGPVRRRLQEAGRPLPMTGDLYGRLSGLSVHVNPQTAPQSHNEHQLPTLGGHFQEKGALATLGHLCDVVGLTLVVAVMFTGARVDRTKVADLAELLLSFGNKWELEALEEHQSKFQHTEAIERSARRQRATRTLHRLMTQKLDQ